MKKHLKNQMKKFSSQLNNKLRSLHNLTIFLLVLIMTAGSTLGAGAVFANNDSQVDIFNNMLSDYAIHDMDFGIDFESGLDLLSFYDEVPIDPPPNEMESPAPRLQGPLSEPQNFETSLDAMPPLYMESFLDTASFQGPYVSQARQNYFALLEGNYRNTEIPGRFIELFGHMSPDYILHNYTTIFDITSEEMDQAILRILTRGARVVRPYAYAHEDINLFSERTYTDLDMIDWAEQNVFWQIYGPEPDFPESIQAPDVEPIPFLGDVHEAQLDSELREIQLQSYDPEVGLIPDPWPEHEDAADLYLDTDVYLDSSLHLDADLYLESHDNINMFEFEHILSEHLPIDEFQGITPLNTSEVRVTVVSTTSTSVTLDLFFNARHNPTNNILQYSRQT